MKNELISEKSRSMSSDAWLIFNELKDLRRVLIKSEYLNEADELEHCMRSFWFYSLFDSSCILTIAGPQGVGKSLMTNTLLHLSQEECLPVGEVSCEHIPIILVPAPENAESGFAVLYSLNDSSDENALLTTTRFSFKEAKEHALKPQTTDLVIIWHVKNCPTLGRLSPLVVLPGLELNAPWEDAIRFVLDVSDIVLYTVDSARKAQASATKIEAWMKDVDLTVPPVTVITKTDMMSSIEIDSLKKSLGSIDPVFIGQDLSDMDLQYEKLWDKVVSSRVFVPSRQKSNRFKRLLRKTRKIISSLHEQAFEGQKDADLDELLIVDRMIRNLDEYWNVAIKSKILDELDSNLAACREDAINKGREQGKKITASFWKKTGLWIGGGPTVQSIINIENAIRHSYSNSKKGALGGIIESQLRGKLQINGSPEFEDDLGSLMTLMLLNPINSMQKDTADLIKSMKDAGKVNDAMNDYVTRVTKGVKSSAGQLAELQSLIRKGKGAKIAVSGTLAAGGAATTLAEAAGGGFAGWTASVTAAIAGAAIAAVAVSGITISIIRSSRDVEWQLENYTRSYAAELEEITRAQFSKKLEGFWVLMKYLIKNHLIELLGINDKDRNTIALLSTLKRAKYYLDEAEATRF